MPIKHTFIMVSMEIFMSMSNSWQQEYYLTEKSETSSCHSNEFNMKECVVWRIGHFSIQYTSPMNEIQCIAFSSFNRLCVGWPVHAHLIHHFNFHSEKQFV